MMSITWLLLLVFLPYVEETKKGLVQFYDIITFSSVFTNWSAFKAVLSPSTKLPVNCSDCYYKIYDQIEQIDSFRLQNWAYNLYDSMSAIPYPNFTLTTFFTGLNFTSAAAGDNKITRVNHIFTLDPKFDIYALFGSPTLMQAQLSN